MTELSRQLRVSAKSGNLVPAVVVDVFFKKASARLSNTGAVVRNLPVVGGPVVVGDRVYVDYTTPEPTVVAVGKEWLTQEDLLRALSSNTALPPGGGGGAITLAVDLFSAGTLSRVFPATVAGMTDALAAAITGDSIHYHNACLTMDVTIPDGVSLIGLDPINCILKGKVTMGPGSYLQNVGIQNTVTSSSEIMAVEVSGSGQTIIEDCHIFAVNCGTGSAVGVSAENIDAVVVVRDCVVSADSDGGNGYAIRGPA